jgi:ribosomal protein S11
MNITGLKTAFLFFSLVFIIASCKKETPPEEYLRGGNNIALATGGSNVIIAGYNSTTNKSFDACLVLANASTGDTIWSRKFGNTYADAFYSVKNSNEGGFIAAGFSDKASSNSPAALITITDGNGTLIKSATYGGSGNYSQAFCVLPHENADSGYLVSGYIMKSGRVDRDILLLKIKNNGDLVWQKSIGAISSDPYDTLNEAAYSIIAAADSGYYLTGTVNGSFSTGQGKIFLMKVSPRGDSLWTKTFVTGIGYSLTLTNDGGIAIGGTIQETSNSDIIIIKTDAEGNFLWRKTFGGSGFEYGANMIETSDGGFAITGITSSSGAGYDDIYLVKTNSSGVLEWDHTYGGSDIDQGYGIVQQSDGGYNLTGLSNTGGSFIYLNKTSSDGTQIWFKHIQ